VAGLVKAFDADWGGFGAAPKFPSTMSLDLILTELVHRWTPPALHTRSLDVELADMRRRTRAMFQQVFER